MPTQDELRAKLEAINQREKERRATLAARKAKLLAQLKTLARPSKSQRRLDARRKILLGAFILDQLEHREVSSPLELEFDGKRFRDWLTRPTDRAVFGWVAAPPESPTPTTQLSTATRGPAPTDTPLNVPYPDKDRAKALGARWQATEKCWIVPAGVELAPFEPWLK